MPDQPDDDVWGVESVVTLIEKVATLVVTLIRRAKTPNKVLREITNQTQALKDGEAAIDRRVDALFDDKTPSGPVGDDT